jgi:hypothetical protein
MEERREEGKKEGAGLEGNKEIGSTRRRKHWERR